MTQRLTLASLLLILTSPLVLSQDQQALRDPEDAMQPRELIAWSSLQKPQPAPQPLPPRDTPVPQPEQGPDQSPTPPADPQIQQTPAETFVGKIESLRGKLVLQVDSSENYQLAGAGNLNQFEHRNVKVTGVLDRDANLIHVSKIDWVR